ncbi:MAG: hypothetical protein VZR73_19105, partial [Acutalibacteraceae bacterium]|nr:hypothetical protein [Acutalibacteraceae bacterium]
MAEEQAGSVETASADTPGAGGEDTAEEAAGTQENVSYIDADGQTKTQSATVLAGNEESLTPGWYVVDHDITYSHSLYLNKQNGSGDFHIILADNKTMQIGESSGSGINDGVGLGCAYDDSRKDDINLYIYAQSSGNSAGKLNIYDSTDSDFERSQIGDAINVDELTINGGTINAIANGQFNRAINSAGNIIINCGNITANAREYVAEDANCGWAIYSAGNLIINDGNVTAQSGGGNGHAVLVGDNGSFTINNGKITAVATGSVGDGLNVDENINIYGGEIKAESRSDGEGGGFGINTAGNIAINGGQVTAKGVAAGIYASN